MDDSASHFSRRKLLLALFGGLASVGVLGAPAFSPRLAKITRGLRARVAPSRFIPLAQSEMEQWVGQAGSMFTAAGGYHMKLVGVRPLASAGQRPSNVSRSRAFLAVFEVIGGQSMVGDLIYTVRNPQSIPFDIFLSSAGDATAPGRMHALFN